MKVPCFVCERARYDAGSGCFRGKLKEPEAEEVVLKCINQRLERQRDEEECRERELQGQGEDSLNLGEGRNKNRDMVLEKKLDALKVEKQYLYEQYKLGKLDKETYLNEVEILRGEERIVYEKILQAKKKMEEEKGLQKSKREQGEMTNLTGEMAAQMIDAVYVYGENKMDIVWKDNKL